MEEYGRIWKMSNENLIRDHRVFVGKMNHCTPEGYQNRAKHTFST